MSRLLELSAAKIQLTDSDEFGLDTYPASNHSNVSKNQLPKFHSSEEQSEKE